MPSEGQADSFILNALTCPITLELFVDPVLADDGYTYERTAIMEWIKHHNETSPMTRQSIRTKELKPNLVIKQLADQYRIISPSKISKELITFSDDGTLLNSEQKILINKLFPKDKKWSLIYKATRDGFDSGDFHRICNNRSPTLTVIRTRNRLPMKKHDSIFGGYTTIPWSSRQGFHRDPQAFLFLFTHNKLLRFNLRSNEEIAVSHHPTSGPVFGLDDIHICHRSNINNFSRSRFPYSYEDLDENGKGKRTFSKSKHFLVDEIEVYMVII
jgi:hypothetical protein